MPYLPYGMGMGYCLGAFLSLLSLFNSASAESLVGPEFTFTNDLMKQQYSERKRVRTDEADRVLHAWHAQVAVLCEQFHCKTKLIGIKGNPAYLIEFNSLADTEDFAITISLDPYVVEATVSKGTIKDYEARRPLINAFIFDMAQKLQLFADNKKGGGHISFDIATTFKRDPQLLRNFLVDQANFPELQLDILGGHFGNAPPVAALGEQARENFATIIDEFDQQPMSVQTLIRKFERGVYIAHPLNWPSRHHYQALRFAMNRGTSSTFNEFFYDRMELRFIRAQDSLDKFLDQVRLFERRLEYLKTLPQPLKLAIPDLIDQDPKAQLNKFKNWLEEMGGELDEFAHLMAPELKNFYEIQKCQGLLKL